MKPEEPWDACYKRCRVCGKPLNEHLTALALRRLETVSCSGECTRAEYLKRYACCPQAQPLDCVCTYATTCPVHGDRHHGTHD